MYFSLLITTDWKKNEDSKKLKKQKTSVVSSTFYMNPSVSLSVYIRLSFHLCQYVQRWHGLERLGGHVCFRILESVYRKVGMICIFLLYIRGEGEKSEQSGNWRNVTG